MCLVYEDSEALLAFEHPEARNKKENKMSTNACFSSLNHAEWLRSVEQSMNTIILKVITSENKAVIAFDHPGNRSMAFDIQIAEPSFQFPHKFQL